MADSTRREEVLDRLTAGIASLTTSEAWQEWLDVQSRFHRYSFNNTILIHLQRPDATRVAGFRTWKSLGRSVRKGEKGIVILAPIVRRVRVESEDEDDKVVAGTPTAFRTVHVFDIAQTDGDSLPEVCHLLDGEEPSGIYSSLVEVAQSIGYTVEEDYLSGARNGDCNFEQHRIRVEVRNSDVQQVKTLAHELAHAILHDGFDGGREVAELEAESVAYIVCDQLALDSGSYSFGYVATWAGGGQEAVKAIGASGQRIVSAARQILDGIAAPVEAAA